MNRLVRSGVALSNPGRALEKVVAGHARIVKSGGWSAVEHHLFDTRENLVGSNVVDVKLDAEPYSAFAFVFKKGRKTNRRLSTRVLQVRGGNNQLLAAFHYGEPDSDALLTRNSDGRISTRHVFNGRPQLFSALSKQVKVVVLTKDQRVRQSLAGLAIKIRAAHGLGSRIHAVDGEGNSLDPEEGFALKR